MATQKRSLAIKVRGKSPNTVTIAFTEATTTDEGGVKRTEAQTEEDDFAIGTAIFEAISNKVTGFIEGLQEDEGPTLFTDKKTAKRGV